MLLEDFGDVRLQRDQVRGILGVAPNRDRARDVLVDQTERSAEQVDAGGDQRRTDTVVVEDQRLHQIVGVALVIRRVDDAVRAHGADDVLQVLVLPFDLPKDGIERMLQRPVELVPLRRPQLVEVGVDLLAGVFEKLFARQYGLGDFV